MVVGSLGYLFGATLEAWLGEIERYDAWVLLGILLIGGLVWLSSLNRRRRVKQAEME